MINDNDSPALYLLWEELVDVLTCDEAKTLLYLQNCEEDVVGYISEVFDDLAINLQSLVYIQCLERLKQKFPNLEMASMIEDAKIQTLYYKID